jgi:ADP-ribose pyrophosphatase YjhB (NUDIX family)
MPSPSIRAAGILLSGEWVLLHRRLSEAVWALPGGKVEIGESAAQALGRELAEELSLSAVCGQLVYVAENFFRVAGAQRHEVGFYFLASVPPASLPAPGGSAFAGVENAKRLEFCWFKRSRLSEVDLRPPFLVAALAQPRLEFQHVVERQPAGL